jgi:glutamate/tyrosine decarboxylase-like PLP-dependent enzyme
MVPELLEKAIETEISRGNKPFFVNSMAGSTVMGAFDDFHAVSDIAKR